MSLLSNRKSLFIATVTAAAVFVMFGYMTLKPEQQAARTTEYNYVIAKNNIKKGDIIMDEDIAIKNFPINIQGTYRATGEILGRKAAVDIAAGKPVMTDFIEKPKVQNTVDNTPNAGFRTVPVLITSEIVPKNVTPDMKFDFITSDNSLKIDNLRILEVSAAQNKKSKIVLLEIKDKDVQAFLDGFSKVKGVNILKKNPDDYGEYKFRSGYMPRKSADYNLPSDYKLPPVDKISSDPFNEYGLRRNNQVEVIVGNSKNTMEFSE